MKRVLLAFLLLASVVTNGQTVLTVGPGQQYLTITDAYGAIPATINGPYEIQLMAGYNSTTETWPITFDSRIGSSPTNTIKIFPMVANLIISCPSGNGAILFDGAEYVELNGSVGAINDTINLRVFKNSSNGNLLRFTNGASYNEVRHLDMSDATSSEVVLLEENCNGNTLYGDAVHSLGGNLPSSGIYLITNTNVLVENCRIYDVESYFLRTLGVIGNLDVRNNHFYGGTNSSEASKGVFVTAISENANINISGNHIGGSMDYAQGDKLTLSYGIHIDVANYSDGDIRIKNNVFQNIEVSSTFYGVSVEGIGGDDEIVISENTVGDSIVNESITPSSTSGSVVGIYLSTTDNDNRVEINDNFVGGIQLGSGGVRGIIWEGSNLSTSNEGEIRGNVIGGNLPNSIEGVNLGTFEGINVETLKYTHIVQDNIIQNVERGNGGSGFMTYLRGGNAKDNTIRNILGGWEVYAIETVGSDISDNTIENISCRLFTGIRMIGLSLIDRQYNVVNDNTIRQISAEDIYGLRLGLKDIEEINNNVLSGFTSTGGQVFGIHYSDDDDDNATDMHQEHFVQGNLIEDFQSTGEMEVIRGINYVFRSDSVKINNNIIRNVNGSGVMDGIFIYDYGQGNINGEASYRIENNLIDGFSNSQTSQEDVLITGFKCWRTEQTGDEERPTLVNNVITGLRTVSSGEVIGIYGENISVIDNTISRCIVESSSANFTGIDLIRIAGGSDTCYVYDNHIFNISSTSAGDLSGTVTLSGIRLDGNSGNGNYVVRNNQIETLVCDNNSSGAEVNGFLVLGCNETSMYNNIVRLGVDSLGVETSDGSNINGLKHIDNSCFRLNFLFNTIFVAGDQVTDGESSAIRLDSEDNTVQGNILANTRSNGVGTGNHYSVRANTTLGQAFDYNLYHNGGTGGVLATVDDGTTDLLTLTDFQNEFIGQNFFSVVGDPLFIDPLTEPSLANLSPMPLSPAYSGGVYYPFVDVDFFYNQRSFTPTIGAIENAFYVGIEEAKDEESILVYPNPVKDFLNIESAQGSVQQIKLYNGVGALVLSETGMAVPKKRVDLNGLTTGVYLLVVEAEQGISRTKLVVE